MGRGQEGEEILRVPAGELGFVHVKGSSHQADEYGSPGHEHIPHGSDDTGFSQVSGIFDRHVTDEDVRVSGRAEPDAEESDDSAECVGKRIEEPGIEMLQDFKDLAPAAGMGDDDDGEHEKGDDHENGLDHVRQGDSQESAECRVEEDDEGGDQDSGCLTHSEARGEVFSSGVELGGHVGDHEDQDDEDREYPQDIGFVLETGFEKVRESQVVHHRGVSPQPFSDKSEEEDLGCDVAGDRPDCGGADFIRHAGDTEEKPGRPSGHDSTQGDDEFFHLASAEEEFGKAGGGEFGGKKADSQDDEKVEGEGGDSEGIGLDRYLGGLFHPGYSPSSLEKM